MARTASISALVLEHDTNIVDRHIRMTVKDGDTTVPVDVTIPGRLSLDPHNRPDGWRAPEARKEFKGAVASALLASKEGFEKMGLRVVEV